MSLTTLSVINDNGSITFSSQGTYNSVASNYTLNSNGIYNTTVNEDLLLETYNGNLNIVCDTKTLTLSSDGSLSNAIVIKATNNTGGILTTTGSGGYSLITANGDINLLSQGSNINIGVSPVGTSAIQQTQNITIECFNNLDVNSGDMYFVSSDVISFVSNTGDIQFGTSSNGNPIIKFQDGNVLINQSSSDLDYQLDVAITHESSANPGYNGIVVNSKLSNVSADLTLQTSNTLGDGTQSVLSLGSFGSNNSAAIFQTYLGIQSNNTIIRLDGLTYSPNQSQNGFGNDFTYNDIGRTVYWPTAQRFDTITALGTFITSTSDTANVNVSGTYTGTVSSVYLIQIDSVASPNTFMWSNDGGVSFAYQFVPITLTPITLEYGIQITFTQTTGFSLNQQFTFQAKITATVGTTFNLTDGEIFYTLQPFYSYIKTTTPTDIVIKTNNMEKMRITGDGAIGIQQNLPNACLDLNSNYNKVILVNQSITGYQINPSISYLNSGGYIIVWNSQDNISQLNFNVFAQRYLADGSIYDNNFIVNQTTAENQSYPSVGGNRLGNSNHYIVAWSSYNNTLGKYKIFYQIFHNNEPLYNFDIQLDSTNPATSNQLYPRVAGLYNGNYVIVWSADDTGSGIYSIKGAIVGDDGTVINSKFQINASSIYNVNFPYVAGLPNDDSHIPNGFVVAYMVAVNGVPDPRYTISVRMMNPDGTYYSAEIPITAVGNSGISSISDGLVSVGEINLQQVNSIYGNGGFLITFYRNYQADTSLYNVGDNVVGLLSGATATINSLDGVNRIVSVQNVSNRFLIQEEIQIISSVPNIGNIIEKINDINFLTTTTANITLDIGSKDVVAYRFPSNLTQSSDDIWNIQVNTTQLYTDTDRLSGNVNIFAYKRPLSAVSIDNTGSAIISWSNDSIPSIYYQLVDIGDGSFINLETRLTSGYDGLKQRNQVVSHLQSIGGNDYGFVISWDNQSLDLYDTGIYQQLIGYNHSLLNLEDGNSNFIFNHENQCGIGTATPAGSLHVKSQLNSSFYDPSNPASIIIQNTSKHVITGTGLQNITCQDGYGNVLTAIRSGNSLRYNDLYPLPENLIGFYKFDETQGTQARDSSGASSYLSNDLPVYINTSAILMNFDIENCWNQGIINNSLLFDGNNNYCFIENTAPNALNTVLETKNEMSIALWVNIPSDIVNGITYDCVSNGGNLAIAGTYLLSLRDIANNGNLRPTANVSVNGVSTISLNGTTIINDNIWHYLVFTVSLSGGNCTMKLYVDGALENTTTQAGVINAVQHGAFKIYIGSRDGTQNFFRGYMDELRFYNKALIATDISTLYYYGNPNTVSKGSLFINPNNSTSYNLGIVIDDNGNINNLGSKPLPFSILSGEFIAYQANTTIFGIGTLFTTELTVGDLITLDIANGLEFTVISIVNDTLLTTDSRGYTGPEVQKPYQSVLRRPSIYTFFDNGDNIRGHIDNYGNLMIGASRPTTLLQITGNSLTSNNIPEITITNNTVENTAFSRKTAVNFRGYDATNALNPEITLAHIEVGHQGAITDNKGIMRFFTNNGTQENNLLSLTSNGFIGIGGVNTPLSIIHVQNQDTTNGCDMILQSNYYASNVNSIFDERSNLYFTGLTSITETVSTDIQKKVLASVSGSNDSNSRILNGRLDFLTNNDDFAVKNGIEARMSITHTGNVGINIIQPPNTFTVAPERRITNGTINTITGVSLGGGNTTITLNNNIFSGLTTEQKNMFVGGRVIIGNVVLTNSAILSITGNNQFVAQGNLTAWNGYNAYIHYAGLNVVNNGFIGINTTSPNAPLSINGAISQTVNTISSNITVDTSYYQVLGNTNGGNVTVFLPTNSTAITGRMFKAKNIGSNSLFINGNGSTIDTNSSIILAYLAMATIMSDGTNWWTV